ELQCIELGLAHGLGPRPARARRRGTWPAAAVGDLGRLCGHRPLGLRAELDAGTTRPSATPESAACGTGLSDLRASDASLCPLFTHAADRPCVLDPSGSALGLAPSTRRLLPHPRLRDAARRPAGIPCAVSHMAVQCAPLDSVDPIRAFRGPRQALWLSPGTTA